MKEHSLKCLWNLVKTKPTHGLFCLTWWFVGVFLQYDIKQQGFH
jgi:hypothetical protein